MTKSKIIGFILALGLVLIAIFSWGLYSREPLTQSEPPETQNTDQIRLIATKPEEFKDFKEVVILPTQVIELTFSHPFVNVPEIRATINPEIPLKLELSDDRKTLKVSGEKPFELGQGYTFTLKPDTKFDDKKKFDNDLEFRFSTIAYKGV